MNTIRRLANAFEDTPWRVVGLTLLSYLLGCFAVAVLDTPWIWISAAGMAFVGWNAEWARGK